jgi:hypothetical protein
MSNVWKTLSAIDVSNHIEQKGNLNYLSWAWAWSTLCEHYPESTYSYTEPKWCQWSATCEVEVSVTVEGMTRTMWLPVMDYKNKSIQNPSSRDISDARIRCLVKAIAMHGLGMCLYMGETTPQTITDAKKEREEYRDMVVDLLPTVQAIKDGIAIGDLSTANEAWRELTDVEKQLLWKAPSKGGVFTTKERATMKTTQFREAN